MAAGLVSIPNRYMHSAVEMISLDDIDRAADLLAEFALASKTTPISRRFRLQYDYSVGSPACFQPWKPVASDATLV